MTIALLAAAVLNQGSPKPAAKPAKKAGRGKKRKAEDEAEAAAVQDAGSALGEHNWPRIPLWAARCIVKCTYCLEAK